MPPQNLIPPTVSKQLMNFIRFLEAAAPANNFTNCSSIRDVWTVSGLSGGEFAHQIARFLGCETIAYDQLFKAQPLVERFSSRFLREFSAFPFIDAAGNWKIAIAELPDPAFEQAARIVLEHDPKYVIATFDDIALVLTAHLQNDTESGTSDDASLATATNEDVENLRDLASGAPVVRAISDLCEKAVELRATDLHLEPMRDTLLIRLRVDGVLIKLPSPPAGLATALISRIKILAGLNIAERRIPQDGAARMKISGAQIDVRVAILPTQYGESAVLRFLPTDRGLLDLGRLGLSSQSETSLKRLLQARNGMLIISGPTGSGKTTTLAGALAHLNDASRKIVTIEDPIEYELPGITQSQVHPEVGLTFATALRAFLRFDPNVIMVGEIRDGETAQIAVQAALTGHLLLTTLHTETAVAVVPRLIDLGVEDFLLQSTLKAVIAQRLVRRLCDHCKKSTHLTQAQIEADPQIGFIGLKPGDMICEAVGCERCGNTGYRGRSGVFEILEITPALRPMIKRGIDGPSIEVFARNQGFQTMMDDARAQILAGKNSISEAIRVVPVR